MGIITKEVEVKVNSNTVEYYKSLGYKIPMKKASKSYFEHSGKEFVYDFSKTIIVKVSDLHRKSNVYLDVLCDMCKDKVMSVRYADYNREIDKTGSYTCTTCSHVKSLQTNIARYGNHYFTTEEFKNKRKSTMISKYGFEHYLQDEDCRKKYNEVCVDKYGENYSELFYKRAQEAFQNNTGYANPAQSPEIKEKICMTNLQKYGCENPMQSPEVRAKANETLCKNGNQKTSKQQLYLHSLYGGELNFFVKYYATDICFPEERLIIEYDGGGHALRVVLGRLTQEEFDQKEIIRSSVLKREGYKRINIVSNSDKLPQDDILLKMLSDSRHYFQTTSHTWQTYDIDKSLLFNAENLNGIPYDFGVLRTIKDNDIQNQSDIEQQTNKKGA